MRPSKLDQILAFLFFLQRRSKQQRTTEQRLARLLLFIDIHSFILHSFIQISFVLLISYSFILSFFCIIFVSLWNGFFCCLVVRHGACGSWTALLLVTSSFISFIFLHTIRVLLATYSEPPQETFSHCTEYRVSHTECCSLKQSTADRW